MKRVTVLAMVMAILLLAACGARSEPEMYADEWAGMEDNGMVQSAIAPEPAMEAPSGAVEHVVAGETFPAEKMIVYNGALDLVVLDTVATQDDIGELLDSLDGYILSSESYRYSEGLLRVNLTLRVPAEQFNAAMTALRELALEVTRDSVSSEDVTQEYVDLSARLRALETKAERLEQLMEEAEDTEAVLAVYEQLSATQQEIEQTKGRMQYLERSAAMATITVSLTPDELSQPVEIAGWRPQGTLKRAVEALIGTGQFLVEALIWLLIYVAPVLLIIGLVIFGIVKLLIRLIRLLHPKSRKAPEPPSQQA